MRIGLQMSSFTGPKGATLLGKEIKTIVQRADAAGFASFWVMDHFFPLGPIGHGVTDQDMLEAYTTLGYVAGISERMKLGVMVTGVTYHEPALLVKAVTTLDVLSGGRAYLGIGAAWFEEEHIALGVRFPPLKERFERLEETLQIAYLMWNDAGNYDDAKPFDGTYYHLKRTLNVPQSIQRPHPPILIGGTGEQKTLRMVAQYGDACNLSAGLGDDVLKRKLSVLQGHCETYGRAYTEIEKTSLDFIHVTADGTDGSLTVQGAIDYFGHLAELGFDQAIVTPRTIFEPETFDIWQSDIIPAVSKIAVAGR